jgi:hypothetical protein
LRATVKDVRDQLKKLKVEAAAEIKELKVALKSAQKREQEIAKMVGKKVEAMVAFGEKWEKKAMKAVEKKVSGKKTTRRKKK